MKGIVFTEFLELVEEKFGIEVVDEIIENSSIPTKGIYSAVGSYPHMELIELVNMLSKTTGMGISDLLSIYGEHMFNYFTIKYHSLFVGINSPIEFLSKVDAYIHVEVQKLYPDAELPKFTMSKKSNTYLEMIYESHRCLSDFALGLIRGCATYFQVELQIKKIDLSNGNGSKVKFEISLA